MLKVYLFISKFLLHVLYKTTTCKIHISDVTIEQNTCPPHVNKCYETQECFYILHNELISVMFGCTIITIFEAAFWNLLKKCWEQLCFAASFHNNWMGGISWRAATVYTFEGIYTIQDTHVITTKYFCVHIMVWLRDDFHFRRVQCL